MVSRRAQRWLVVARRRGAVVLTLAASLSLGVSGATFSVSTSNSAQSFASASAFDYATLVTAATPWLWWRLGDTGGTTTADGSGNSRTGTLSTAGIARGGDGAILQDSSTSFAFDGSAGCLAASATHANPTTFSVEAWFRTTSTTGGLIVGFEGSSALASGSPTTYDRQVFLTAAGNVAFGMKTSSPVTVTSPGAYNDGQWHYVTATFGGGGQKLYLDGVLAASNANTSAATLTATWHAGCGTVNTGFTGAPSTGYLQANLDEVAVYTSELSATAVANRMTAAPPHQPWFDAVQSSRPWGWWRMADSSGTTLADASGNSVSGTTSGSGITRAQTGAIATNSAMTFNGSAGCAVVSTAVVNPTTFSVEAWFRTTTTSGGWIVGFSANASANATASFAHDRNVYMTNSGTLVFGTYTGSVAAISTTSAYTDGAWHHVVATLSSAGQRLYVDGALSASAA